MIAFHFPPHSGSSGIQRTLRFAQRLPAHGWEPIVLTASNWSYEHTSPALLGDIPPTTPVYRAWAFDAKRHLSLRGHYLGALARPDRWRSWWLPAVIHGLLAIRKHKPDVIWSTFPIASAHRIAATLSRLTGLPWVADLRDPMAHDGYPREQAMWDAYAKVERRVFSSATAIVTVTEGCAAYYAARYPDAASRIHVIKNAHDPEATPIPARRALPRDDKAPLTLLHSGIVYPWERDPRALLGAVGALLAKKPELARQLRIVFRAPGDEAWLSAEIAAAGVGAVVSVAPAIPFREAVAEMLDASVLLILQAGNCNLQIPAKLYEYAHTGRPVLTLSDPSGETWKESQRLGLGPCAPLDDARAIEGALINLLTRPLPEVSPAANEDYVARTGALAALLDAL
ncbi:glycosyltransferase [Niveibacterium sp. 24ML]|uniref:glycosyltransferase n=1 Tax=Niveibacterium sp. 24ML TaxID=2985512 RepID=UPI00226E4DD8|nr:glycosyltransferase [Niveibacterium sp. 24ML]MCX9156861.1 glycosyltransferase [Niveibacterium sp. 24ML]